MIKPFHSNVVWRQMRTRGPQVGEGAHTMCLQLWGRGTPTINVLGPSISVAGLEHGDLGTWYCLCPSALAFMPSGPLISSGNGEGHQCTAHRNGRQYPEKTLGCHCLHVQHKPLTVRELGRGPLRACQLQKAPALPCPGTLGTPSTQMAAPRGSISDVPRAELLLVPGLLFELLLL